MSAATTTAPHDALGANLKDSALTSAESSSGAGVGVEDGGEPIPSLASLLLSTAQSLATRSKAINKANASSATTPKVKPPPPYASVSNPSALLANPTSTEYLASLLAMPLPTLLALPNHLSTLSTSLDTDLSSLAFTRYSSFLLAHTATQSISTSFSTLSANLSSFIESTDALKDVVSGFEQRVSEPRKKRERMALVRERMEEVEELMEAPSVVDACVRAGYWAEAIDVALRLSDLHKRLSKTASYSSGADGEGAGALLLLERVREEVSVALLSLRARVLESLLQRGLKLPAAVRGVSILRRIGERGFGMIEEGEPSKEMDEDALRVVFLAARWRCLRGELESVEGQMAASGIKIGEESALQRQDEADAQVGAEENEERTRWTKRWIEVWREIVGETVGMYTEVLLSSTSPSSAIASGTSHALPSTAPLALFLTTSLTSLSDILAYAIPSLTSPSSLSSLLTQLSYCSHSFARHGLEFRELQQLRERVEARVGRIVVVEWEAAGRKWEKEWRDGWEGSPSSSTSAAIARRNHLLGGRPPISDWLVSPEGLSQVFATPLPPAVDLTTAPPTWHHQPSQPLALLPPIARFLNAHATALNALRLLPPLALYPSFLAAQARELDRATQVLAAFTDAWLASLSTLPVIDLSIPEEELSREELQLRQLREDEKQLVIFAVAAFGRWVVPWCEGGLKKGVYGELVQKGMAREEREKGVVDAIRRVEGIIARIEGREVEPSPSPAPTPIEETPPPVLKTNGITTEEHHDLDHDLDLSSPSSGSDAVIPIPFDPSPLAQEDVDPAIVEASIVADDHVPELEPPAVHQVEREAPSTEEQEQVTVPEPELAIEVTAPEPESVSAPENTQEEPPETDIDQLVAVEVLSPQQPASEETVVEDSIVDVSVSQEASAEEPVLDAASIDPLVVEQPVEQQPVEQQTVEQEPIEEPSIVEDQPPSVPSSAAAEEPSVTSDSTPAPPLPPVEPTQAEEDALEAPIEELDVDKMPLANPTVEAEEMRIEEEPEVQIAVEEPVLAEEQVEEELEVETEQAATDGDEGEGEEDEAWGI